MSKYGLLIISPTPDRETLEALLLPYRDPTTYRDEPPATGKPAMWDYWVLGGMDWARMLVVRPGRQFKVNEGATDIEDRPDGADQARLADLDRAAMRQAGFFVFAVLAADGEWHEWDSRTESAQAWGERLFGLLDAADPDDWASVAMCHC
ncbi:MAG: hypothetical protein NTV97_21025 [Alphaproteobacteria bacterium]|nr:hypothetical protein [Alphaproteobacteria bacterium]